MAQEQLEFEGSRWLRELRAAIGAELVDIRYSREGEGIDFLLVYETGGRDAARQRFVDAMQRARGDIPPFEFISFELGQIPEPWDKYWSIKPLAHAS